MSKLFRLLVISFSTSFLFANTFAASEFLQYAKTLSATGVINAQNFEVGYRLTDKLSRAESAKLVVNAMKIPSGECSGTVYADVSAALGNLCGYIETANSNGLIASASYFRPNDPVTRAEFAKFVANAAKLTLTSTATGFSDVSESNTLSGYINALAEAGIINITTHFRPNDSITRGEAFKMLVGAIEYTMIPVRESIVSGEMGN
ncbi:MAG: S-layer homology domain-containing protein [Candidatus Gracilibacteria bacterium]|nr:S-layer homology domain-containing protein [Candidatus Gracilibacteria bacterium]